MGGRARYPELVYGLDHVFAAKFREPLAGLLTLIRRLFAHGNQRNPMRYDLMNQNTKNIFGGSIDIGTLGLNWYLTPRFRFMTNGVHVFATHNGPAAKAGASCSQTPAQGSNPNIWLRQWSEPEHR
jgi:hypothetical protein